MKIMSYLCMISQSTIAYLYYAKGKYDAFPIGSTKFGMPTCKYYCIHTLGPFEH